MLSTLLLTGLSRSMVAIALLRQTQLAYGRDRHEPGAAFRRSALLVASLIFFFGLAWSLLERAERGVMTPSFVPACLSFGAIVLLVHLLSRAEAGTPLGAWKLCAVLACAFLTLPAAWHEAQVDLAYKLAHGQLWPMVAKGTVRWSALFVVILPLTIRLQKLASYWPWNKAPNFRSRWLFLGWPWFATLFTLALMSYQLHRLGSLPKGWEAEMHMGVTQPILTSYFQNGYKYLSQLPTSSAAYLMMFMAWLWPYQSWKRFLADLGFIILSYGVAHWLSKVVWTTLFLSYQ